MQLPYYMALHNALPALFAEGRYVKPCNKAIIAFHISMTAPNYAINTYNCTHSSLSESFFRK